LAFEKQMTIRRALIYRLGSLGDTIIALPAFHAIRRALPDATLTLLTNKPVSSKAAAIEEVLGKGYFFEDVLDYPLKTRNPLVLAKLVWRIRRRRIDAVINLTAFRSDQTTLRDSLFFRLAGVRHLIGFRLEERDKKAMPDFGTGEVEWEACRLARRVARIAKVDLEDPANWDLRISDDERLQARRFLEPLPPGNQRIAFCTGTKIPAKHWGVLNWVELVRRLSIALPDWSAIFLGASEESEEAMHCMRGWQGPMVNLCGVSTPRVSAAILSSSRLLIGHDSGPMHLAACVGTPCVAVFSARNIPRQWFPRGDDHRIIYHRTECAGCGLEVCVDHAQKCMTSITVEEVLAAARTVLAGPRQIS